MSASWQMQEHLCNPFPGEEVILMLSGQVCPGGEAGAAVEARRGMAVFSDEGYLEGRIAAVAVSRVGQKALCLLLGHMPEDVGYQLFPVEWVDRVKDEAVYLNVGDEAVRALPDWHAV